MQLESGGYLLLYCALFCWLRADAFVPALWHRAGIDFDIGRNNIGERGVDEEAINEHNRSPQNQMRLIEEAYRWLSELDKRKDGTTDKLNDMQLEVRGEGDEIDKLSEEVKQNTKQIHQLQKAICSLLQTICEQNLQPCEPCPWKLTPESPSSTPSRLINITTASPPSTARPSPDPKGSCGQPDAPENGYTEANSTTLNTLTIIHCNSGFDLIGDMRMICTAIWNEANAEYQYSWAPPMSSVCKANGKPTPSTTSTLAPIVPTKTASATPSVAKTPSKREYDSLARRGFPSNCFQPKKVGVCKAAIPRFFYNQATGDCEKFTYGGCHGNGNNFGSERECLCRCKTCP